MCQPEIAQARTPALGLGLRETGGESRRRYEATACVAGSLSGFADDELVQFNPRVGDLEHRRLWPGAARFVQKAVARGVLGRTLCRFTMSVCCREIAKMALLTVTILQTPE